MPIALYIHVPFCVKKCFYCDFTSYPLSREPAEAYLEALRREIELYGWALSKEEREVSSLFFGGGTPTCLPADSLAQILDSVKRYFKLLPGCEVTVEANPGTVDLGSLRELAGAGVNRLSLGIQAFQEGLLAVLGRVHSGAEALDSVRLAREAGLKNLNLDFIFGIPGQTAPDWRETLAIALKLAPEHVSVYGLQLEEGTPLEQAVNGGEMEACPEDLELTMFNEAIDFLTGEGFDHYEISNFARPGRQCAHNLNYWLNGSYLGLGPAAHSCLRGERFSNIPSVGKYFEKLSRGEYPIETRETVTLKTQMAETMFLGLRLIRGVDLDLFNRRFERRVEEVYHEELAMVVGAGLAEVDGGYLRLTTKGLPVANSVFREFV